MGMDKADDSPNKGSKSPRFPAMALPTAVEKAKVIWEKEGKHALRVAALAAHWDLSEKSSGLRSYVAALGYFGLLEQVGGFGTGEYKLSERAIRILAGERNERAAALREAALQPKLYRQLWERFSGDLPSDANLESRLLIDFGLHRDSVRGFIKDIRATIDFAKLEKGVKIAGDAEEQRNNPSPPSKKEVAKTHPSSSKPPMTENVRYLSIPLDIGDAPIPVGMSNSDFDLLLETLQLWKKKIVREEVPPTGQVADDLHAQHRKPYKLGEE